MVYVKILNNVFECDELEYIKEKIISTFNPVGIGLNGSMARGDFHCQSDVDLEVFTQFPKDILRYEKEVSYEIKGWNKPIIQSPQWMWDLHSRRLTFAVKGERRRFDITITKPQYPVIGSNYDEITKDKLEIHIGGTYEMIHMIYGEHPLAKEIQPKFFPYYNESLRRERLNIISAGLKKEIAKLEQKIQKRDPNIFIAIHKIRKVFFQWLFIHHQIYPWSYEKRLDFQLRERLKISDSEIEIILLLGDRNLFLSAEFLSKYMRSRLS